MFISSISRNNFNRSFWGLQQVPIYAFDKDGNVQKFSTQRKAADELGVSVSTICLSISDKKATSKGLMFEKAPELETYNYQGKMLLDAEKLQSAILIRLNNSKDKTVYMLDEKGNCVKFKSVDEASEIMGIPKSSVNSCLSASNKTSNGVTFVRSSEIEKKSNDGEVSIDKVKLASIIDNRFYSNAIYSIDMDRNCTKYKTQTEAIKALGLQDSYRSLHTCIKGEIKTAGGYVFARAKDIEIKNPDGTKSIDIKKVNKLLDERTQGRAVYAVDKFGNYRKFRTQVDAIKTLNLYSVPASVSLSMNENSERNFVKGYFFVKPYEIEVENPDGTKSVDENKLKIMLNERLSKVRSRENKME